MTTTNAKGSAGGHPPRVQRSHGNTHRSDIEAESQLCWRVVICTRDAVWARYKSEDEAEVIARRLGRHGFHVRVEADR